MFFLLLNVTKLETNTRQSKHLQHGSNYSSCTSIVEVTFVLNNFLNATRHGNCKVFADILINIFAPNLFNGLLSLSKVVGFDVKTFFLISVHKFSMGLRSGEFSGYLSILTWCGDVFLAKAEVVFTFCHKDKH